MGRGWSSATWESAKTERVNGYASLPHAVRSTRRRWPWPPSMPGFSGHCPAAATTSRWLPEGGVPADSMWPQRRLRTPTAQQVIKKQRIDTILDCEADRVMAQPVRAASREPEISGGLRGRSGNQEPVRRLPSRPASKRPTQRQAEYKSAVRPTAPWPISLQAGGSPYKTLI